MIVPLAALFVGGVLLYAGITGRSVIELLIGHHPEAGSKPNTPLTPG